MIPEESILKQANVFISAKDKDLNYIYCNEAVAEAIGLDSPQQIVGKNDFELFPQEAKIYRQGDYHITAGNILFNERCPQTQKHGKVEVIFNKGPLANSEGEFSGIVVSYYLATKSLNDFPNHQTKPYQLAIGDSITTFSKKEYKILQLIVLGKTTPDIAATLCRSPRTIEDHIRNIRHKLDCKHKHQIIETVVRLGLMQQLIPPHITSE